MALYRAKADGRATYRFFEPEMDARMQARRALESDLRAAIENDEFMLHYQSIINLRTGRIEGFEALLRWHHPTAARPAGRIHPGCRGDRPHRPARRMGDPAGLHGSGELAGAGQGRGQPFARAAREAAISFDGLVGA